MTHDNERSEVIGDYDSVVSFRDEDLLAFADASHDRNPLHLSRDYARKTPYGQPVVFGILGALACLPHLAPPDAFISKLDLRLLNPIFVGIRYGIESTQLPSGQRIVRINDGQSTLLQATATFVPGDHGQTTGSNPQAPTSEPRATDLALLVPGTRVTGRYEPDWEQLRAILAGLGLAANHVDPYLLAALLWSSYLVGMELPGKQALFSRLTLDMQAHSRRAPFFDYEARVRNFDPRFGRLVTDGRLQADGHTTARATIESLVRPESRRIELGASATTGNGTCRGKVVLVIGGSRGLGAAIVQALVTEGAHVYVNFHHSSAEALRLQEQLTGWPGAITLVQGDGSNRERCEEIKQVIINAHGRLDALVCGAAPAVLPLRIEASAVERINHFIMQSVRLVTVPLAVFLDVLAASAGRTIVISSEYVRTLPVDWPHYVAAKAAIEAVTVMAARQYPSVSHLIVRPPKLATDLSSSPFAFEPALDTRVVADAVIAWLPGETVSGTVLQMDISPEGTVLQEPVTSD